MITRRVRQTFIDHERSFIRVGDSYYKTALFGYVCGWINAMVRYSEGR